MSATISIDQLQEILRPFFTQAELGQVIAECRKAVAARPPTSTTSGTPRYGLTPKQKQTFDFIREHIQQHGVAPSFEQMRVAAGLKSKSGIHRIMDALVDRGYIMRRERSARAIMVLE